MQTSTRGYAQMIAIKAPAAAVWSACTQASELTRWFAASADTEARRGGRWRLTRRDGVEVEALIDIFDVGRRLRLIYVRPPTARGAPRRGIAPESPLVDDLLFDRRADEAIIRVLGSGIPVVPDWDQHYLDLRQAWGFYLRELKRVLEPAAGTLAGRASGGPP